MGEAAGAGGGPWRLACRSGILTLLLLYYIISSGTLTFENEGWLGGACASFMLPCRYFVQAYIYTHTLSLYIYTHTLYICYTHLHAIFTKYFVQAYIYTYNLHLLYILTCYIYYICMLYILYLLNMLYILYIRYMLYICITVGHWIVRICSVIVVTEHLLSFYSGTLTSLLLYFIIM